MYPGMLADTMAVPGETGSSCTPPVANEFDVVRLPAGIVRVTLGPLVSDGARRATPAFDVVTVTASAGAPARTAWSSLSAVELLLGKPMRIVNTSGAVMVLTFALTPEMSKPGWTTVAVVLPSVKPPAVATIA